jgi:hypothetical protein
MIDITIKVSLAILGLCFLVGVAKLIWSLTSKSEGQKNVSRVSGPTKVRGVNPSKGLQEMRETVRESRTKRLARKSLVAALKGGVSAAANKEARAEKQTRKDQEKAKIQKVPAGKSKF